MRLRAILQVGILLASALWGMGCSIWPADGQDDCDEARFQRELDELRSEIDAEIGEAEASSEAACRALPLGDKPCGGPWTYLVYSTQESDAGQLESLAADYARLDAERNEACGLVSDCSVVVAPALALRDGRCVASTEGGAGG